MRLTQRTIADIGILVLGLITATILVRSSDRPAYSFYPLVPSEIQRLIDETSDPIAAFKGGKELATKGDLLAAAASFKKATQLEPGWRDAFLFLGQVDVALAESNFPVVPGDLTWWQKAEFALRRAKNLDPLHQPTYDELMIVYEKTGQAEKLAELQTTLKNLPNLN